MKTRSHTRRIKLKAPPETVFLLLITPSSIRQWWGAARAIVDPRVDGLWVASWGEREDDPDYISAYRITAFDPPKRLVFGDASYFAKSGPLPFEASFVIEFSVEPDPEGSVLQVTQDGFPADPVADEFYKACEIGWKNTFQGIETFLGSL